ncbi:hypothetical protein M3Y94_01041600 [Aphelenchoides besseyi]|nr:hypothetical protein M3Y94_01041600 [Aphelenchoides besseyi]
MTENPKLSRIEGQPVKIVEHKNNQLVFSFEPLIKILNKPEVANEKIYVLNVTDKFRDDQNHLLNSFICYLEWLEAGSPSDVNWINIPCDGFKSCYGPDDKSTSIFIWPKLYTNKTSNGSDVKILLISTRDLLNNQLQSQNSATIHGIAVLLSSVLVFNYKGRIGNSGDLVKSARYVNWANQVLNRNENKLLQKLVFLVRDFPFVNKDRGFKAGTDYLTEVREEASGNASVTDAWSLLYRASEEVVGCCLPPFNGSGIPDGNVAEMGDEFGRELRSSIEQLINKPEPNTMNGQAMICLQLSTQLQSFPEEFVKVQIELVRQNEFTQFFNAVEAEADGREDFRSRYETHATEALAQFEAQSANLGEPQHRQMAAQKLREEMDKAFKQFDKENTMIFELKKVEAELQKLQNEDEKREEAHQQQINQLQEHEQTKQQHINQLRVDLQNAKDEADRERDKAQQAPQQEIKYHIEMERELIKIVKDQLHILNDRLHNLDEHNAKLVNKLMGMIGEQLEAPPKNSAAQNGDQVEKLQEQVDGLQTNLEEERANSAGNSSDGKFEKAGEKNW